VTTLVTLQDSREYRIAAIRDGVEYHGVPEDAITDKLNESDVKIFG
jgi:hypothetical protein